MYTTCDERIRYQRREHGEHWYLDIVSHWEDEWNMWRAEMIPAWRLERWSVFRWCLSPERYQKHITGLGDTSIELRESADALVLFFIGELPRSCEWRKWRSVEYRENVDALVVFLAGKLFETWQGRMQYQHREQREHRCELNASHWWSSYIS